MKINNGWPPNIEKIQQIFDLSNRKPVFTFGDTIYNPYGFDIPEHLFVHESVHAQQQSNPSEWWARYLKDSEFRLSQELEAYRKQYQYAARTIKNREVLFRFLHTIAKDLSSEMYGYIINYEDAIKQIKQ